MSLPALSFDDVVQPAWNVSPRVRALVTTRDGGVSRPPFGRWRNGADQPGGLNLGLKSGDDPAAVAANRERLLRLVGVSEAAWLQQIHGADIVRAEDALAQAHASGTPTRADASVTDRAGTVCVVMVADCMPVLLCDEAGRAVGAAHAGWRGLAAGIVEQTARRVAELAGVQAGALHAYLGPAIGPDAFEVGPDVRDAFMNGVDGTQREATANAFVEHPQNAGKYLADLAALARLRLQRLGVTRIVGGDLCTVTQRERFYSYRRDRETGRMAALIWLDGEAQTIAD
ncbi:peptidoglycan editing factor PgeF [Paraburkholderia sp. 22099]|jgi:polyphenol oxidase|uniref:Purine nucleoside phosphorylase n=1 Tax=Paraburkholderia terricola TaxID=169427 RepID=A0ABU1LNG2_9BURK|nr:peptidoglycan editing factor PgeF [Paraburkholderia terricola]AXE92273.1 peptidoglycan editing factor PgeF [Paraburkholderia terricola]MDR6408259.1 YfiH family protein [Paraburkholderia terricola]MDR6481819.1 YfiH family protein [Paraburkholderia terricola]MDR6490933.1 YfiH family protein [Paraburkholderia terricola]